MFQDDIFDEWLDNESQQVLGKFKSNEKLSIEDKMILTLKAQTNHFHHLDEDIRKDIAKINKDIAKLDSRTMTAIAELDNKTMTAISELRKDSDKKFEQTDKRFEQMSQEIKHIYQAINSQTWKMIGAIGLIVVFSKLAESLPLIKF